MFNNKNSKRTPKIRLGVQIFFLVLIFLIAINHQLAESGLSIPFIASSSLHAVCPFGGVVSIYSVFTDGAFIQKIHESSFIILGIVLFLGILFGPVFCGWVCPLGTVQEFVGKIGKKIFKNKYNHFITYQLDKYLRFLRYAVAVWVIYITAVSGKLLFSNIDPYHALFNFWTSEITIAGIVVLSLTLLASLFVERPWCKYTCPFGAILGLTNFVRIFKLRRNEETCIGCKKCTKECPMNIDVATQETIKDHQCISCLKCTSESACPVEHTVQFNTKKIKGVNITHSVLAVVVFVAIFGGIYGSDILGLWKTEGSKVAGTIKVGESVGEKNPADIKGSYTFLDISNNFEVPIGDLQKAFEINNVDNIQAFKAKDLETYYGEGLLNEIGTGSIRYFVSLYNGVEYTLTEETYLPEGAVTLLKERGNLTDEQIEYLDTHTVQLNK